MTTAVIVDAVRTPTARGKAGGPLSALHPSDVLGDLLAGMVARNDVDPATIEDVIAGVVSQTGVQSRNQARLGALSAGFPITVPGTTLDRQCGSSQQAATFAAQAVMSGSQDVVVACGIELMSRVPMGSSTHGDNPHGDRIRERFPDGLIGQGISAELIAARWGLSRHALDQFSAESHAKAARAWEAGAFDNEVLPVKLGTGENGEVLYHRQDGTVRASTTVEKLGELPPSFKNDEFQARFPEIDEWRITPGNSSPLTDGASAALIMSEEAAERAGLRPRARFHSFAVVGSDPILMLMGVVPATEIALKKGGLTIDDIDAFEVNEAFAPVPLAWIKDTGADPARVNIRGGAIALGHPLGGSGTKLLATLLNTLESTGGRYGLQVMCEGGGMANATIIERL
jgi:acetyl-CoA acyltransferase